MPVASTHSKQERAARRQRIVEMRKAGHTYAEIGKELKITSGTVGYYLNGRDPYQPKVTAASYRSFKKDGTPRKKYAKRIVSVLGSPIKPNGHVNASDSPFKAGFLLGYEVGQLSSDERITLIQTLEGRQ
jgi:hypothetical protein